MKAEPHQPKLIEPEQTFTTVQPSLFFPVRVHKAIMRLAEENVDWHWILKSVMRHSVMVRQLDEDGCIMIKVYCEAGETS